MYCNPVHSSANSMIVDPIHGWRTRTNIWLWRSGVPLCSQKVYIVICNMPWILFSIQKTRYLLIRRTATLKSVLMNSSPLGTFVRVSVFSGITQLGNSHPQPSPSTKSWLVRSSARPPGRWVHLHLGPIYASLIENCSRSSTAFWRPLGAEARLHRDELEPAPSPAHSGNPKPTGS
jgi:hypothetical protein